MFRPAHSLLFIALFSVSLLCAGAENTAVAKTVEVEGNNIVGVEILIADEGAGFQSSFGHALIRLVDNDGLWANDTVISFAADIGDGRINPVTGIAGGYKVRPEIRSLYEFWKFYSKSSDRGFNRFVVNLDSRELEQFLSVLKSYLDRPDLLGGYKFFTNNCVSIITHLFNEAGITADEKDHQYIPSKVGKWVDENVISAFRPVRARTFLRVKNYINTKPDIAFSELVKNFSDAEIAYLFLHYPALSFEAMEKISERFKKNKVKVNDAFGLDPLPEILYTKTFNEEFAAKEMEFFGEKRTLDNELRRFTFQRAREYRRVPLRAVDVPSRLGFKKILEVPRSKRDRIFSFRLMDAGKDGIRGRINLQSPRSHGDIYRFKIEGLSGSLNKVDKDTYTLGPDGYLTVLHDGNSIKLYLLRMP